MVDSGQVSYESQVVVFGAVSLHNCQVNSAAVRALVASTAHDRRDVSTATFVSNGTGHRIGLASTTGMHE